jgi:hypothetical protein
VGVKNSTHDPLSEVKHPSVLVGVKRLTCDLVSRVKTLNI